MNLARRYLDTIREQLGEIEATQMDVIEQAGAMVAEALHNGRWFYLFGTGHSHMMAEELFYRAGGLARVRPILHPPLMLHNSASESTAIERDPKVVDGLLEDYPMEFGDVLLIASNSGRNPVPVELALRARKQQTKVIALTNKRHSDAFPSRHPSGCKLQDVADLVLDNSGVEGDACVPLPSGGGSTGAASTVTGAAIVQMIACAAVEYAWTKNKPLELFVSSNAENEGHNEKLLARHRDQVRHL